MATGRATANLATTAVEYLAFVRDVDRYREVDDKLGPIAWVRTEGNVTEFRARARPHPHRPRRLNGAAGWSRCLSR